MKRGRGMKIRAAALAALLCLAFAGCAFAAWDSEREIMRLKDEVPSMEIYGSNDAVVWLRNDESRLTASGSVERLRADRDNDGREGARGLEDCALSRPRGRLALR